MFAARKTHLDDAELMRLVDGEGTAEEQAAWDDHVAACLRCTTAARRLREDAGTVESWLQRAAFEAGGDDDVIAIRTSRPRPAVAPWLRAAAMIALVTVPIAAVAAIPSLREWIVSVALPDRGDDAATTLATPSADAQPAARIRFETAAGEFVVALDHAQRDGALHVRYSAEEDAVLDVTAGNSAVPVVSAAILQIRNSASSTASYTLRVPATVTAVNVRVGERTIATLNAAALRAGADVMLTRAR